ncbi:MarR family winged helix-turn-helix transcriptional regulator [Luteithermobacter gelatinilyticus]|uniref:MarR family winged helix-turn-helix transcriptional regulator n=1 Tax=Luteithermobacter gelatinilyticus TaxID=2582913 RepID=UPI001106BB43|nr:MarR family transcriptional regulator [Luteithermobacter gelatinilyticus]|tara:strand:+ start:4058 stop:4564 length:507 start_codon:yes stop_codon:yes gene_type:complete
MPDTSTTDSSKKRLGLWLRLITDSTMIEKEVRGRFRNEFGVTLPRFDLMSALYRAPGGLTMGELSKQLLVSNGNVTGVVERLQKEGLVKRWVLPTDRRIYSVGLTPKGRTVFKEMADRHEGWINEILGDLDDDQVDRILHDLDVLKDLLKKRNETAKAESQTKAQARS